jgi:hypothetical protein
VTKLQVTFIVELSESQEADLDLAPPGLEYEWLSELAEMADHNSKVVWNYIYETEADSIRAQLERGYE